MQLLEKPNIQERLQYAVHVIGFIPGFYEGMLLKKGKVNGQYLKRKFILSQAEFTLTYHNKEDVSQLYLPFHTQEMGVVSPSVVKTS